MLYAIKANRQYSITEDEKEKYVGQGYKIAELVKGKLVYEEVETEESKEIASLKVEVETLKTENETLATELEKLKEPKKAEKTKGEGK